MLVLHIGTKNDAKVRAVRNALRAYRARLIAALKPDAAQLLLRPVDTASGVPDNPLGFDETILGARSRAASALIAGRAPPGALSVGIGIESGFIQFSRLRDAVFNFDVCCVKTEGTQSLEVYGFSHGTQYPSKPIHRVLDQGRDFQEEFAAHLGVDTPPKMTGFLGVLTDSEYPRYRVSEVAVRHALLRLIHNADFYR